MAMGQWKSFNLVQFLQIRHHDHHDIDEKLLIWHLSKNLSEKQNNIRLQWAFQQT
jgi:hypothetical protein